MNRDKKDEDAGALNRYSNLDKTTVLQETRLFNETPINARKCSLTLTKLLYLLQQGEQLGRSEATQAFFAVTKLWQSNDTNLRRLVYLAIKQLCDSADDVIIVTSSLTKDMTGREDIYRAAAIRALCRITDAAMLQAIERYMKQAIVDKVPSVASAALVSALHLVKRNPEVVRRWVNEVQEAVSSDNGMVQYHALALLYQIRKNDRLAVGKLVQKWAKSGLKSPYAICYLIRLATKLIQDDDSGPDTNHLLDFVESCLRHKFELVVLEAASSLVRLPKITSRELAQCVSVLQLFCSSPRPALRFAAVRTLSKISISHPTAVVSCNMDLEQLITDQNRSIATLAITTLLKIGVESSVERLMKQISSFVSEISDEFKIVVIDAIRSLCHRYPRKQAVMMSFLATMLRDDGGYEYKKSIVDTIISIIEDNEEAKETGLSHLCEFIEDCEHAVLATRVLHLLGREGPKAKNPARYIRFVYNRVILEATQVRAAAVTALAKFGAQCFDLRPSIEVLLARCLLDSDDEVRDRATYYLAVLKMGTPHVLSTYILDGLQVSVVGLERALQQYCSEGVYDRPFDLKTVPISTQSITVTERKTPSMGLDLLPGPASDPAKEDKSKTSRVDIYTEQLRLIPAFSHLGSLFRSSEPVQLTESETEYNVVCIKHTFNEHILLQFDCRNTLNDQLLENVTVNVDAQGDADWSIETTLPIPKLAFSEPQTTYTLLRLPKDGDVTCCLNGTLKFTVRDVDPVTGVPETEQSYEDAYELEEIDMGVADHVQKTIKTNFAVSWDELGDQHEFEDTFILSTVKSIQEAIRNLVKFLALGVCERSDKVPDGKSAHSLMMSGVFRGGHPVLARARLALDPGDQTVTMNLTVRSDDVSISETIASVVA